MSEVTVATSEATVKKIKVKKMTTEKAVAFVKASRNRGIYLLVTTWVADANSARSTSIALLVNASVACNFIHGCLLEQPDIEIEISYSDSQLFIGSLEQ